MVYTSQDRKNFPVITGVYKITFSNSISNKVYIGSSKSISKTYYGIRSRWVDHLNLLAGNNHYSKKLQNAYNKYGDSNLAFEIIDLCHGKDITTSETNYITFFDSYNNGYNSRPVAQSNAGIPPSQESLDKMKTTKRKNREPYEINVLNHYKENKNALKASKDLGISHSVVFKILDDYGITPKNGDFRRKTIYAYLLDGSFVGEYKDAKTCAEQLALKSMCSISQVASRRNLAYKGYWFSYEKYPKKEAQEKITERKMEGRKKMSNSELQISRNIHQYDLDGNLIKIWDTSTEIKEYFKLRNLSPISAVINGRKPSYKGFIWSRNQLIKTEV
jgi:group I intron endonuclease